MNQRQGELPLDAEFTTHDDPLQPIVAALHQRLCGKVRELSLTQAGDQMVLRGQADTYYAKQLAQTIVLEFDNQAALVNEIDVPDSAPGGAPKG